MQRLFSTFADGWPGRGLLIQRALVAAIVAYCGAATLGKGVPLSEAAPQLIAAAAGLFLLIGLWTPIAGAVIAVVELWTVVSRAGVLCQPGILAVLGLTLAMIGPGAWSVDARLFGRKHLEIPNP